VAYERDPERASPKSDNPNVWAAWDAGQSVGRGADPGTLSVPAVLAEALRTNLNLSLFERMHVDMEWLYELQAVRDAFTSGQTSARQTAAEIARETGTR
jgi:hypothetical protein